MVLVVNFTHSKMIMWLATLRIILKVIELYFMLSKNSFTWFVKVNSLASETVSPAETALHADGLRWGTPVKMGLPSHGTGGEARRRNASQFERARQSGALARYGDAESLLRGTRAPNLKLSFSIIIFIASYLKWPSQAAKTVLNP